MPKHKAKGSAQNKQGQSGSTGSSPVTDMFTTLRPSDAVNLYFMLRHPADESNDLVELINLLIKAGCTKSAGKTGSGGHTGGKLTFKQKAIFTYSTKSPVEEKCQEARDALLGIGVAGITDVNLMRIVTQLGLAQPALNMAPNMFIEKK